MSSELELERLVRAHLRQMTLPAKQKSLYPSLHAAADAVGWHSREEAIGMVFRVVCEAVGATYKSQYMSNVLNARYRDGTMARALRAV